MPLIVNVCVGKHNVYASLYPEGDEGLWKSSYLMLLTMLIKETETL